MGLYVAAYDSALCVADEEYDFVALLGGGEFGLDAFDSVADVKSREIEVAVDFLDVAYILVGEATAAQTNGVNSCIGDRLAGCLNVGRDVLVDEGAALNHHVRPDVAELVNESSAADNGEIVDNHLAGKLSGV